MAKLQNPQVMAASELKLQKEQPAIEVENVLIAKLQAGINKPNTPWNRILNKCKELLTKKLQSPMDRTSRARFRQRVHLLNNVIAKHDSAFDHVNIGLACRLSQIMDDIESELDSNRKVGDTVPNDKQPEEEPLIESQTERVPSRGSSITTYGLDVDPMAVENHLLCRGAASGEFNAVGIYGAEGVGKTTLAQEIFHREKVRSRFMPRIWICLSDSPDSDKGDDLLQDPKAKADIFIAKRILLQLGFDMEIVKEMNRENLIDAIESELRRKRYLIVLDGASEDLEYNTTMMKMLRESVPKRTEGGVIVTGRAEKVVREMVGKDAMTIHRLLPLDKPVLCWDIYMTAAEEEENKITDADERQKVKDEVVKRSDGLPWASTLLGIIRREIVDKDDKNPPQPYRRRSGFTVLGPNSTRE